ncbi:hypothetical protein Tco_0728325 [Tanacetum coccineum]|uniref:Uncharacterized protein n=1 Tax=Tanacetum coccineum TaxID=301880 RepID=A0ABQ4YKV2_9ASTR
MFEFSLCFLADSVINLVSDSSRLGLRSGYEEFPLFRRYNPSPTALYCPPAYTFSFTFFISRPRLLSWAWIAASPSEVSVLLVLEDVPFLGVFSHFLDGYFSISGSFGRSVECQYAILSSQNTPYCLEKHIRRLDYRIQYDDLGRRFDTSYPTGGYGVSGDQSEHNTI